MAFDPSSYKKSQSRRDRYVAKYGDILGTLLDDFISKRDKIGRSNGSYEESKINEITFFVKREVRKYEEGTRDLHTAVNNIKLFMADLTNL